MVQWLGLHASTAKGEGSVPWEGNWDPASRNPTHFGMEEKSIYSKPVLTSHWSTSPTAQGGGGRGEGGIGDRDGDGMSITDISEVVNKKVTFTGLDANNKPWL